MAANRAAVLNYLENTLLIADQEVRTNFVDVQGFSSFDDGKDVTIEDIESICKNMRRPGGTVANPQAAVAGQPPRIPNPGLEIGHIQEHRLKMMVNEIHHCARIQRTFQANQATLQRLRQSWRLYEEEKNISLEPSEYPPKCTKTEDTRKTMEDIETWLLSNYGDTKVPLAYVTREHEDPPERRNPPEPDGGYGVPDRQSEMIRRAPHIGHAFEADKRKVWAMLKAVFFGTTTWGWIKHLARSQNAREAYSIIQSHYMGTAFQNRIKSAADKTLETVFYNGKSRNFTFDSCASKLNSAFNDLEAYGEPVGQDRRVRHLLRAIQDPNLATAKATVMATPTYRQDFNEAVNFVSAFANERESMMAKARQIGSLARERSGGGGRGRGRGGGGRGRNGRGRGRGRGGRGGRGRGNLGVFDPSNPNRFYTDHEWWSLTEDEFRKVLDSRGDKRKTAAVGTEDEEPTPEQGVGNSLSRPGKKKRGD